MEIRVIELTFGQVAEHWNLIWHSMSISLPPLEIDAEEAKQNLLTNLMSGKLSCWAVYKVGGEDGVDRDIIGMYTTGVMEDYSGERNCIIYTATSFSSFTLEEYQVCFNTLATYARSKGCKHILAYTNLPVIKKMADNFDGSSGFHFLRFRL